MVLRTIGLLCPAPIVMFPWAVVQTDKMWVLVQRRDQSDVCLSALSEETWVLLAIWSPNKPRLAPRRACHRPYEVTTETGWGPLGLRCLKTVEPQT